MDKIIIAVIGAGGLILGAIITFLIVKMANKGKASSIITDAEAKGASVKRGLAQRRKVCRSLFLLFVAASTYRLAKQGKTRCC